MEKPLRLGTKMRIIPMATKLLFFVNENGDYECPCCGSTDLTNHLEDRFICNNDACGLNAEAE